MWKHYKNISINISFHSWLLIV